VSCLCVPCCLEKKAVTRVGLSPSACKIGGVFVAATPSVGVQDLPPCDGYDRTRYELPISPFPVFLFPRLPLVDGGQVLQLVPELEDCQRSCMRLGPVPRRLAVASLLTDSCLVGLRRSPTPPSLRLSVCPSLSLPLSLSLSLSFAERFRSSPPTLDAPCMHLLFARTKVRSRDRTDDKRTHSYTLTLPITLITVFRSPRFPDK
jgi:hypothetical protein